MNYLNLGVVDFPHAQNDLTTGDLAEILEARYKVFSFFYEKHKTDIQNLMIDSLAGSLESVLLGAEPLRTPLGQAAGQIETLFRKFLSEGLPTEFESMSYGDLFYPVPTQAALDGINHRFKKPKTGNRRPSLIDTGEFEASFAAWLSGGSE